MGGTGLEPVTPSLSSPQDRSTVFTNVRIRLRFCSRFFAFSAQAFAALVARFRVLSLAPVSTGTSCPCSLGRTHEPAGVRPYSRPVSPPLRGRRWGSRGCLAGPAMNDFLRLRSGSRKCVACPARQGFSRPASGCSAFRRFRGLLPTLGRRAPLARSRLVDAVSGCGTLGRCTLRPSQMRSGLAAPFR
jgi:hypothetical protein